MVTALTYFLLYSLVFFLIGQLFVNYLENSSKSSIFDYFFFGIIITNFILNITQLFIPVSPLHLVILVIVPLFIKKSRCIVLSTFRSVLNLTKIWFVYIFVVCVGASYMVSVKVGIYDTYLYHDQMIHWLSEYPLIPGLANLHGRFGFNNSMFTLFASQPQQADNRIFILHGLLFIAVILWATKIFFRETSFHRKLILVVLISLFLPFSINYLSSPSPDYHSVVFSLALFFHIIDNRVKEWNPAFVLLMLAYIPTLKMSLVVFAAFSFVAIVLITFRENRMDRRLLLLPSLLIAIWILRNLVLSGQIIYPSEYLHTNYFEHSVGKAQVKSEIIGITGWARSPGTGYRERYLADLGTFNWVSEWYKNNFNHTYSRFPFLGKISIRFFVAFSLISLLFFLRQYFKTRRSDINLVLVIGLFLNLIFWFLNAPDWRFGSWIFIFIVFLSIFFTRATRWSYFIAGIIFVFTVPYYCTNIIRDMRNNLGALRDCIIMPNGMGEGVANRDSVQLEYINDTLYSSTSPAYFVLKRAVNGDQCAGELFPCVPYNIRNLEMIGSRIEQGVRLKEK